MLKQLLSIGSIEKLEKWHGHLYNWYDTKPKTPGLLHLAVDSGNLRVISLPSDRGCWRPDRTAADSGCWRAGLTDTFTLMSLEVRRYGPLGRGHGSVLQRIGNGP